MILRSIRLCFLALAAFGGCTADVTRSTDGNTSFASCKLDRDCSADLACVCGACSRECQTNSDCASIEHTSCVDFNGDDPSCVAGKQICVATCAGGADCPAGLACIQDRCLPSESDGTGGADGGTGAAATTGGADPGGFGGSANGTGGTASGGNATNGSGGVPATRGTPQTGGAAEAGVPDSGDRDDAALDAGAGSCVSSPFPTRG